MPIFRITTHFTEGITVPANSDILLKTPPGVAFTFEVRGIGSVLNGTFNNGHSLIPKESLEKMNGPAIFLKHGEHGMKETIAEIMFI